MGFPIRKSSDQSSFAAPQGLSQRTTSFIASQRQGIHRMPLNHFITLMIDVRLAEAKTSSSERPLGRSLSGSVYPDRQIRIALAEHNQRTMRSSLAWCDHEKPCGSP